MADAKKPVLTEEEKAAKEAARVQTEREKNTKGGFFYTAAVYLSLIHI